MLDRSPSVAAATLLAACLGGAPAVVLAQSQGVALPPVTVTGTAEPSLTSPPAEAARQQMEQIPGAVAVVPDDVWQDTRATTLKDILDYTPGVFAQPKWGEDSRLSIRGSGLSRNFHLRGIQLYQDGVPVNSADGGGDFQEIDPTAFRYVEVYKGANAARFGAGTLGGAINFVSPTGHDADLAAGRAEAGSFGFRRLQASSGGEAGPVDAFVTGSRLVQDGFRDHSEGESWRAGGNLGLRLSDDLETRLYLTLVDLEQEIPGSVTRAAALGTPRRAAPNNLLLDYQRNMESWRIGNRTTLLLDSGSLEFGGYYNNKHLIHPIFQYLDYNYRDYGLYGRWTDERTIAGHGNRFLLSARWAAGEVDNSQSVNLPGGVPGALLSRSDDRSTNLVLDVEDMVEVLPRLSVVGGLQYVNATRKRQDRLATPPDSSGTADYAFVNPRIGFIWQVEPAWQVFGNLSRSSEAPTFSELNFTNAVLADIRAQRATTVEVGTRGRLPTLTWNVAAYRAELKNEFQFFDLGGGNIQVTNADRTIHQGIEAGLGWAVWTGLLRDGSEPDRLWLNAAYTFSDFRFDDDAAWGDNDLPGAPRHYLRAELMYRHPGGFSAGPNVEWVPDAYVVDNANTLRTERYAVLGFRAAYDLGEHLSLFLDLRNLTDERYIASAGVVAVASPASALFEPGSGRAAYLGARLRW